MSAQQIFAIDCSNGSMSAHAEQPSRAVAHLHVVPRVDQKPAAFVIVPKQEYTEYLSKHCRAPYNASKVLSCIVYRCQRNRPGEQSARLEVIREGGPWGAKAFWWLHTRKDIADECKISEDQVRTAVDTLVKQGFIAVRRGRHPRNGEVPKYRGETVWHLRLGVCQRGNGLTGWPSVADLIQMRIVLDGGLSPSINGEQSPPLLPDTLELLDTKEEKTNTNSVAEKPATKITPPEAVSGKDLISQNQAKAKSTPAPYKQPVPDPIPDQIDERFLTAPASHRLPVGMRKSVWACLWADTTQLDYPASAGADLKREHGRLLGILGNKVEKSGVSMRAFIAFIACSDGWDSFRTALPLDIAKGSPPRPNIPFLSVHLVYALECFAEKTAPKPVHKPHCAYYAPAVEAAPKPPEEPLPTQEKLEAMWAESLAAVKNKSAVTS